MCSRLLLPLSLALRLVLLCGVLAVVSSDVVSAQPRAAVYVVQSGDTLFRIASSNGMTVGELKQLNGLDSDLIVVGQRLRLTTLVPIPPRPLLRADGSPLPPAGDGRTPAVEPSGETPAGTPPDLGTPTTVTIPVSEAPPPSPSTGPQQTHVVRAGETLFAIALRYDTTVDALRRLNGIEGDAIQAGQRLVVGGQAATPVAGSSGPRRRWSIEDTTVPVDQVHFVMPGETLYSIAARLGVASQELASINELTTAPLEPGQMLLLPHRIDPRLASEGAPLPPPDTVGLALVYPRAVVGRRMASGVTYDPDALTASHRTLPLGSVVLVTNPASGRSTFVRIADRGPVSQSYLVELSEAAAERLALDPNAARRVELRRLP